MSRIPKHAQRAIDKANRARQAQQPAAPAPAKPAGPPRRMEAGVTSPRICGMYDVFLDGVQQVRCKIADVDGGFVVRYIHGKGNRPEGWETERLEGKVEIRPKRR